MLASYQKKLDEWKERRKYVLAMNISGKSYSEISKELDITASAVSQLIKKARQELGEPEREGS